MQVIELNKVIANIDVCSVVKFAAMIVQKQTYLKLADFMQMISVEDLTLLSSFCEVLHTGNQIAALNMMCLSEILAFGEGMVHASDEESRDSLVVTVHAVTLERLKRKGLITIKYENLHFDADPDSIIANVTEEGKIDDQT